MIYYIKNFKRIGRTCTHANIEIAKIRAIYHQQYTEEAHKDPEVVPTQGPKEWTKTLETAEDYIRGFRGVDGQPLSYGLRDDLEPPADTSDPIHRASVSKCFTHNEDMIACGLILSGPVVFESVPETVGPFTNFFITDRALI